MSTINHIIMWESLSEEDIVEMLNGRFFADDVKLGAAIELSKRNAMAISLLKAEIEELKHSLKKLS